MAEAAPVDDPSECAPHPSSAVATVVDLRPKHQLEAERSRLHRVASAELCLQRLRVSVLFAHRTLAVSIAPCAACMHRRWPSQVSCHAAHSAHQTGVGAWGRPRRNGSRAGSARSNRPRSAKPARQASDCTGTNNDARISPRCAVCRIARHMHAWSTEVAGSASALPLCEVSAGMTGGRQTLQLRGEVSSPSPSADPRAPLVHLRRSMRRARAVSGRTTRSNGSASIPATSAVSRVRGNRSRKETDTVRLPPSVAPALCARSLGRRLSAAGWHGSWCDGPALLRDAAQRRRTTRDPAEWAWETETHRTRAVTPR